MTITIKIIYQRKNYVRRKDQNYFTYTNNKATKTPLIIAIVGAKISYVKLLNRVYVSIGCLNVLAAIKRRGVFIV